MASATYHTLDFCAVLNQECRTLSESACEKRESESLREKQGPRDNSGDCGTSRYQESGHGVAQPVVLRSRLDLERTAFSSLFSVLSST